MLRAIKYELNPNKTQVQKLNQVFGNCRFVYNWALDRNISAYTIEGKRLSAYDLMKELTVLKKDPNYEWLLIGGAQQLQQAIRNLDTSFKGFFKSKKGFPRFKSKNNKQAFKVPQDFKIDYDDFKIYIPKIGWIKFFKDKKALGVIKSLTITKSTTGRVFASVLYESATENLTGIGSVGIDLGIKVFAVTSDGEVFENQKHLKNCLAKLRLEKRKLFRKTKGGKNYKKQLLVIAKLYEKISNQRKDFLNQTSTYLAKNYETVCIEDLNVKGMMRNRKLSLAISDMGWGNFRRMLEYKVKDLRVIGRFEPSSQICNICGAKNAKLRLSDRIWTCENNHLLDRDLNAAINIKNIGLRTLTLDANVNQ